MRTNCNYGTFKVVFTAFSLAFLSCSAWAGEQVFTPGEKVWVLGTPIEFSSAKAGKIILDKSPFFSDRSPVRLQLKELRISIDGWVDHHNPDGRRIAPFPYSGSVYVAGSIRTVGSVPQRVIMTGLTVEYPGLGPRQNFWTEIQGMSAVRDLVVRPEEPKRPVGCHFFSELFPRARGKISGGELPVQFGLVAYIQRAWMRFKLPIQRIALKF